MPSKRTPPARSWAKMWPTMWFRQSAFEVGPSCGTSTRVMCCG
jgi:hypothetical protein